MPFRIALSGLNAATADLNVTANNIANSNTAGFQSSRAEFADVFAVGSTDFRTNQVGNGVRLAKIAQQFAQGNVTFTDSNLDLAVNGSGFFTLHDSSGFTYTRNGILCSKVAMREENSINIFLTKSIDNEVSVNIVVV